MKNKFSLSLSHTHTLFQGVLQSNQYLAFGPADPLATSREMVGSDVVAVGYQDGFPFAIDSFITSVEECNYNVSDITDDLSFVCLFNFLTGLCTPSL